MKFGIITIALFFSLCKLSADQLEYLTLSEAEEATEYLSQFEEIVSFCGCCDNDIPAIIRISDVEYRHTGYEEYYEVMITGENTSGDTISEAYDMAYIWVNIDDMAQCVGMNLGFECDPCAEPFNWPYTAVED